MKKKIAYIITLVVVSTTAFFIGKNQTETKVVIPESYVNTESYDFYNNYVDMREVCDFDATETGLYIHLTNGEYYYWER